MIAWLRFQMRSRALERTIDKISRLHNKAVQELQSPTCEDKQRLYAQFHSEQLIYEEELAVLTSSYMISLARRMFLPVPDFKPEGGAWEEASTSGRYYLNAQALSTLRSSIRKERKERHEICLLWLAALTGLVGAVTGLVAVWGN